MNRREFNRRMLGSLGAVLLPVEGWDAPAAPPRVDGARLMRTLTALARHGATPEGGASRVAYSDADREGRAYVRELMREAGLQVEVDAAGNLLGHRRGSRDGLSPIWFGSHIDTVPNGGNFDGTVGSLAAVEVARTLSERRVSTRHPLTVVVFQNEEGGLFGSRAVSGELRAEELGAGSHSGKSIREGIAFLGGDPDRIADARRRPGEVAAFVELHIEQGGVLERERLPIGIVEGIVGINWWEVTFEGFANHAGTTPMDQRRDALLAAARFVDMVHRVVRATPGRQVGTVGRIQASPGAPNVIPGRVACSLELRDLDAARIRQLFGQIRGEAEAIAQGTGTTVAFRELHENTPAPTDERVRGAISAAARELDLGTRLMPSGAGHDAQSMAKIAPTGMIFIPSVGGVSHSPRELSRPEDIANGADVLLRTLLRLDRALDA